MVLLNGRAMHEVEPTMEAMQAELEMLRQENAEQQETVTTLRAMLIEKTDELASIKRAWKLNEAGCSCG